MKVGINVIFIMAFDIGLQILRRENEEQEKAPERGRGMKSEAQKGPSKTLRELKTAEFIVSFVYKYLKSRSKLCLILF